MKKNIATFLLIYFLAATSNLTLAQTKLSNKIILDSLEVLKKVGGFVEGYGALPTVDEERYYNITRMLFYLPFSEAKLLLKDKNPYVKAYGFTVVTKIYFDSLTQADLEIFKDTSKLLLFTSSKIIDPGITLGQYCEMGYSSTIEERNTKTKEPEIIVAISTFIKNNAKFPDSYEPSEFSNYLWTGNDNEISYEIQHKYRIKRNDGKSEDVINYFILDKDFRIMLIEWTRSKTISVDPPELEKWLKTYGILR